MWCVKEIAEFRGWKQSSLLYMYTKLQKVRFNKVIKKIKDELSYGSKFYFGHSLGTFAAKGTGIHSRASFLRISPQLGNLYQVSPCEFWGGQGCVI